MAKKKEEKIDFSDKTIADVYEGEVCNNLKLIEISEKIDVLIKIFDNINQYVEQKKTGTLGVNIYGEGTRAE
jgi:hypothetical protein